MKPRRSQPLIHSGSDDLESFLAWSEQIELDMSESNPLLYQVLGNLAFSKHPIAGADSFQTKAVRTEQKKQKSFRYEMKEDSPEDQGGDPA